MQGYVKLSRTRLKDWRSTATTTTTARGNRFIFISQSNCKTGVIEVNSASLGQHYRLIVKFKMTLDQMRSQLGVLLEVSQYTPGLPKQNEEQTRNATGNLLVPIDY